MIIIYLTGTSDVLGRPGISEDCNGDLDLCEDGLDQKDSECIVYACPTCRKWLFKSNELKWTSQEGYWQSPGDTLDKPYYHSQSERLSCPGCDWNVRLSFFSYGA